MNILDLIDEIISCFYDSEQYDEKLIKNLDKKIKCEIDKFDVDDTSYKKAHVTFDIMKKIIKLLFNLFKIDYNFNKFVAFQGAYEYHGVNDQYYILLKNKYNEEIHINIIDYEFESNEIDNNISYIIFNSYEDCHITKKYNCTDVYQSNNIDCKIYNSDIELDDNVEEKIMMCIKYMKLLYRGELMQIYCESNNVMRFSYCEDIEYKINNTFQFLSNLELIMCDINRNF